MFLFNSGDLVQDTYDGAVGTVLGVRGGKMIPGMELYTVEFPSRREIRNLYSTRLRAVVASEESPSEAL